MVARTHDQRIVHLPDLVEQRVVHVLDTRSRQVHAAAVPDKEAVAGEDPPGHDETARVRRVTWGVDDFNLESADVDDLTVLEDEVLPDVAQPVCRDFPAALIREPLIVEDMIDMVVRVEDESNRVTVLLGHLLEDAGVEAWIKHGRGLRGGIPHHISEVRHRTNQTLLEEHRTS